MKFSSGKEYRLKLYHLPKHFIIALLFLFISTMSFAQVERISLNGTVIDKSGEPLIGASILEQGTTNGTITDIDGKFNLSVPKNAILEFSYIGYTTLTIPLNGKSSITVTLKEDELTLDEVVVTALGIKRESKALGYAMTEIKSKDLDINSINPVSALQGKAAGVQISGSDGGMFGSTKIQIRGASTLGKNNQPIYVIDGVILDNNIHDEEVDFETNSNDYGNE